MVPVCEKFGANEVMMPVTTMPPSPCRATPRTSALGLGKNVVSSVPSVFSRARWLT